MSETSPIVDSPDGVTAHNPPRITPLLIQQKYYDSLMDCDWVKYESSNGNSLIQNIAFALFGTPSAEGELVANGSEAANGSPNANTRLQEVHLQGYTSRQKEQVMRIYQKLREQGKYSLNDQDILMSVILVVCCKPNPLGLLELEPSDYWWNIHNRSDVNIWCTAVFRVRKCIPAFDGARGCRIYVDADARVYQTWESYLRNNTQPKCVLVVPENGEYRGTLLETEQRMALKVSVVPSPSLGPSARIIGAVDTTSTLASLGAISVLSAAVFTPVAPVALAAATVTTVAAGLYGMIRSGFHLRDRSAHEQAISPTDAEARGSWINIAASTVSVTGGAANNLLSRSASAGTNMTRTGLFLEASVDVLRHANLVTGGIGVVNSLALIAIRYHKHGETPSSLELFQFTASTLFFANAVMSNRTAKSIIEEAQNKTINNYRETLRSTKDRENFDKRREATRQVEAGEIAGDTEVIRCIRNISDKDQYFHDVLRTDRDTNTQAIRVALTPDGHLEFESEQRLIRADNDNVIAETLTEVNTDSILKLDLDGTPAEVSTDLLIEQSSNPTNLDSLPVEGYSSLQVEDSFDLTNLDSLPVETHTNIQADGHNVNPTNLDNLPAEPLSNFCSAIDPADTATPDVYSEATSTVAVDTSGGNENEKPTQQPEPVSNKTKALQVAPAVLQVTSYGAANASVLFQPSSSSASMGGRVGRSERDSSSLINISPSEIVRIGSMLLRLTSFGAENVADLLQELSKDLHSALLTVSLNVLAAIVPEQLARLRVLSPEKDIIVQVVEFVFNYMKHQRPFGEPCTTTDSGFVIILKDFFQDGHVRKESILFLTRKLEDYINEQMSEMRRRYPNKREITCESCSGIRYA